MRTRESTLRWAVISLILVITCGGTFADKTIYVDDDAAGANDGSSWTDAYKFLQDALADAISADKPVEIRVAQGIYRPDRIASEPNGTGDRTATFQLISSVALKGGYAGLGQADPNVRDIEAYETILSGDLAGNDVDVNDPCDLQNEPTRAENSNNVVTGSGKGETYVLDAFTIAGGNAEMGNNDYGGGMYNEYGCARITDCRFISNSAEKFGGGIANTLGSLTLTNCTFIGNSADISGGGIRNWGVISLKDCMFHKNSAVSSGGGMLNVQSSLFLNNCTFRENSAKHGGGMDNYMCSPFLELTNCTFIDNSAAYGGGMENAACVPSITKCIFIGNSASDKGGGMHNQSGRGPFVTNCIFIGNLADYGAGIWYSYSGYRILANCTFLVNSAAGGNALGCGPPGHRYRSNVKLTNCILWDGGDEIWSNNSSTITVSYSDVKGGQTAVYDPCDGLIWGEGNIDAEPLFADPNNCDYHLKSQAGRWDSPMADWVKDDVTSPCIDAGDMGSPIGDEPFPNGGRINMGAYGGTAEASKSYFGEPPCGVIIAGDINGDCNVDLLDFSILASGWLEDTPAEYDAIIEISVATDKPTYVSGEEVTVLVTARNPNPEQVTLSFNGGLEASYLMDGTFDSGVDEGLLGVITYVTIGPYDSYTWELTHGFYSMERYPLGVGTHTVAGAVWGYGRSAPTEFEVVSE
jgi:predicted outer membrane repeat protein